MVRVFFAPAVFLAACLAATAAQAQSHAVYKCTHEGKTSYGDRPCAQGSASALPPLPSGIGPADVVQNGDSRSMLELEKLREKNRAAERKERARREEREERELARSSRLAAARREKCEKLRLRVKWAEEDARQATGKPREALVRKARRQQQAMAVECRA